MEPKPKILELCLTLDTGGLERVVVNLANELSRNNAVAPQICTVAQTTGAVIPGTILPEVRWTELQGKTYFTVKTALRLASLVRQQRISLLHAHGTQPLVYALTVSLMTGVPIVFTKHSSFEDMDFFTRHRLFRKLACRRVSKFFGVSDQATEILKRVFSSAADRCETQINGTELPKKTVRQTSIMSRNAYTRNDKFIFVTVCRLAPEKDLVTLLHAFCSVHDAAPNTELWIVGDGAERAGLVKLAESLGINNVRFWGFRGKVEQILTCADVFVNSSWTEGISISILEAMSLGLPIVATAVGGTPTIVKPELNGLLVEPRDPANLSAAMLRLVHDPELCRRLGDNSWRQVELHWSLPRMAQRYLEAYQSALGLSLPVPPKSRVSARASRRKSRKTPAAASIPRRASETKSR